MAIVIPDTGLLLLPISPTIRDDTVAKKNPNTTIINAENKLIGTRGISHNIKAKITIPARINDIGKSLSVLRVSLSLDVLPKSFIASLNVVTISGNDFIRLINPPAATAPAPIYLI